MKRIVVVIIVFIATFNLSAQIITDSVQGLDCYNDTGFIALDVIPGSTISWEYEHEGVWMPISAFSFIITHPPVRDTLWTTKCRKYRATVYNPFVVVEVDSFSIACPVTIGQGQENILCYGDSSGILKRPVHGGTPFDPNNSVVLNDTLDGDEYYTYTWYYADDDLGTNSFTFSDTTETLDSVYSGWYKTIVTDAIGCSDSINYSPFCINYPALIRVDTQIVNHNKCIGETAASIFLRIQGGIKYNIANKYFYYLTLNNDTVAFSDSTGSTGNFTHLSISNNMQSYLKDSIRFNNLAAGSYIFSVVDSNACVMQDTIEILEPDAYTVYTSTTVPLICASDTAVFFIDSITGGNPNINYSFLGFGNDTINVPAGTYDILVEDSLGCTDTLSATLTAQYEITVEDSIGHVLCFGDSSGIINIDSIYGGNTPYTIQWGGVDPQALSAGTYTVFFADNLGCTLIQDFTVEQSDPFSANAIFNLPTCNGFPDGSIQINLTGGVGGLTWGWLNGAGSGNLISGPAGIYSVEVTDSLSCSDTIVLTLNEPEQLAFAFSNYDSTLLCRGDETTIDIAISGGTGPFSVLWDDGNTDLQRVLPAGIYSCQVSDTNGCTTPSNQIIITEPDAFSIQSLVYNSATCNPDILGDAIINTVGGTDPIQYIWNTGETSASIDSLWEVNYWVIATDSCGNTVSDTFDLVPSDFMMVLIYDSLTHTGSINIDTSIGGPFSYQWIDSSGNIISTSSTTPLCEGTYYVTTTDNTSNCSVTDSLDVPPYYLPDQLPASIMDTSTIRVFSNDSLWGALSYTFLWSDSSTSRQANLCPGSHWVRVTDDIGCVVQADFEIAPYFLSAQLPGSIIDTSTSTTRVFLDSLWGALSYTFLWSDSSISDTANLCPGSNWLEITDNIGCIVKADFEIAPYYLPEQLPDAIIDISTTTVLPDDSLWGALFYTFLWSDTSTSRHANICPGSHSVRVTDNFGCVVEAHFDIDPLLIVFEPEGTMIECSVENLDVELEAVVSGGTAPYTYQWSGGSTENPLDNFLNPGNHSVTVMDNNACTEDTAFTIAVMTPKCIPNVFTPNGDGINDTWNLENTFLFEDSEVLIYGRFGKRLFESIGYPEDWDGKNKNGNDVPAGVYFYSIEIGHDFDPIKGTVTILK